MPILLDCGYDETHEYPDDWEFGGANDCDPRADIRWQPTTYIYLDAQLREVHITQTPLCLEEALDQFTLVNSWGDLAPVYIQQRLPGERAKVLDFEYSASDDTVYPLGES